jgi:hypothetical protein
MTMDLVTGMGPGPHIDGRAWGELNAGIIGPDDYVLQIGDRLACTMQTANKAVIGTGAAVMQGRHVTITQPETVTIQSGTQGQKRNDLICLRYERDTTTNIETARMVAYKGTPTTGTPTDPTTGTGDILALSDSHDMPLYRIPLDGISVGTPIPLYKTLTPVGVPRTQHADFGAIAGSGTMTVTRVADRAGISSVTGMAVLAGSGTMTQIPFVIPSYPARRIGVSITPAGDVNVMVGAEISIDHGFLDIHFR